MKEIVAIDFFVVPTIRNQVLYVFPPESADPSTPPSGWS